MFFQYPLEQVTEVIALGERISNVQIDIFGTIAKNVCFLGGFSGSYKNIVTFLGLFIVFVSVLSILFFFRPKYPEKVVKNCCSIENPGNFFNLDCKTVFNNLCPAHKTCVWDFVDSIPECV